MKISEIVEATGGTLLCGNLNDEVNSFSHDTRTIKQGDMYIPIIGEVFDGHQFINQAFEKGASSIITSLPMSDDTHNIILVKDTHQALGDMARWVRIHSHAKVIGITGSVGKTSTKDMIYSVVSTRYKALKTIGNYNNDIGLPQTILRYQDEEVMVIEMGMNHLKEIDYLTHIALPDIAVITNVGTAHIGEVGSREKILEAKMEITHGLNENGLLIVNGDNDLLQTIREDHFLLETIGIDNPASLNAYDICLEETKSTFMIDYHNQPYQVTVNVPGKHFVYNALISIQTGLALSIDIKDCIRGVACFELTKNRADMIETDHHVRIYDGTYNANVDSMKASIDVLSQHKDRKIAVLGDMLELGDYEERLHREVGTYLSDQNIDITLTVGKGAYYIYDEVIKAGKKAYHFANNKKLIDYLKTIIHPNDVVLIKGSNGMHLKEVIKSLEENI